MFSIYLPFTLISTYIASVSNFELVILYRNYILISIIIVMLNFVIDQLTLNFTFLQQEGGLCAQHCLNSLLQGNIFSALLFMIEVSSHVLIMIFCVVISWNKPC